MKSTAATLAAGALLALSSGAGADQKLALKHECLNCHQVNKKVVGPAFADVAKKYKGDASAPAHLLEVIKRGGKGVWGNIPMPPHPQVPEAEAKSLVKWVLSL